TALGLHPGRDSGVNLLEDPWGTRHERGLDLAEVVDNTVEVAVDRRGEADAQLERLERLAERVRQRQPEILEVVDIQDFERVDRNPYVHPVVVDQPDALGLAGRTRRIDERREVLW